MATCTPKKLVACGLEPLTMLKSVTIFTLLLIVVKGIHQKFFEEAEENEKTNKN